MLGKLSSVHTVLDTLKAAAVRNWAVKEFVQGTKTRRWAVAWSFQGARPTKVCCSVAEFWKREVRRRERRL